MFRNSYLDTYKHAVMYNKEVEFMFVHLSHIYTTLGSVINDIEYQFGLLLAQTKSSTQKINRNSTKTSYGSSNAEHVNRNSEIQNYPNNNQFSEIQTKLENFGRIQRKKIPEYKLDQKIGLKQAPKVTFLQVTQQKDKRNTNVISPIVQNTQDFDALFYAHNDQEHSNQKSNSQMLKNQPKKDNLPPNTNKPSANNKPKTNKDDFMDHLFGN